MALPRIRVIVMLLKILETFNRVFSISQKWDLPGSSTKPFKFQPVWRLGFVTAPTFRNGSQPNFARCLAVSWAGTLYIHFFGGGSCLLTEFCQVQNSLCVQVLRYPILAALLHGTRAVSVSQTLRRGIFSRQGGHFVRHWAVELSIGITTSPPVG